MDNQFINPLPVTGGYIWIPKIFFRDEPYQSLSAEAKLLFALLQDRISLSAENKQDWTSENGLLYVRFTLEEVTQRFNCGMEKASKIMRELETVGLIQRDLQHFPRTYRIHVIRFQMIPENQETGTTEKPILSSRKSRKQIYRKSERNNLNQNNPDSISDTERLSLKNILKENISYESLLRDWDRTLLDGIIDLMLTTITAQKHGIWIAAEQYPFELVRFRFLQIRKPQMQRVLEQAKQQDCKIPQMTNFLLELLFNAAPDVPD